MEIRTRALRLAYRVGYQALRPYWLVAGTSSPGVKCVLVNDAQVVLVRHTYGDRKRWNLPGGNVKRHEQPLDAARREMQEELGLTAREWTALGELEVPVDGRHDVVTVFQAQVDDPTLTLDRAEIAEARWFPSDDLPQPTGRHVRRLLALASC